MPSRSWVEKYAKKKKRKHDTSSEDSSSDSDSEASGEVVSLSYRRSPTPRSPTPPLTITKRKAMSPPTPLLAPVVTTVSSTVTDMVRRLEEELDSSNGESWHFNAELVRTSAQYEHAQEHNTKTMGKVATLTGDLEEANLTIHGHTLRNIDLMSRLDALRHQVDVVAIDKEFLHASTQTDPLPSVVTSPSLVAGRQSPPPVDDARQGNQYERVAEPAKVLPRVSAPTSGSGALPKPSPLGGDVLHADVSVPAAVADLMDSRMETTALGEIVHRQRVGQKEEVEEEMEERDLFLIEALPIEPVVEKVKQPRKPVDPTKKQYFKAVRPYHGTLGLPTEVELDTGPPVMEELWSSTRRTVNSIPRGQSW